MKKTIFKGFKSLQIVTKYFKHSSRSLQHFKPEEYGLNKDFLLTNFSDLKG